MVQRLVISLFSALAVLTAVNAWWQYHYHSTSSSDLRERVTALERELVATREQLSTCQADSLQWKEAHEREGYAKGHLEVQHADLVAEVLRLNHELSECKQGKKGAINAGPAESTSCPECSLRLSIAVRELRRLQREASQRALDAQVTHARMLLAGHALNQQMVALRLIMDEVSTGHEAGRADAVAADKSKGLVERIEQATHSLASSLHRSLHEAAVMIGPSRWSSQRQAGNVATTKRPCEANVSAVIPFRGRGEHLRGFFEHMRKFLASPEASHICWSLFLVEQYDMELFNRGWLFNVGFAMSKLSGKAFRCIVFQDLDTLPDIGAGVDYADCKVPTQLSSEIECYGWLPPYADNAGGVVSMGVDDWLKVNGFSNEYSGWGGEDDDLRWRLLHTGLLQGKCGDFCSFRDRAFYPGQKGLIRRPPRGQGRFICLDEKSHTPRQHGDKQAMMSKLNAMSTGTRHWTSEGLSSLQFQLIAHEHTGFPGLVTTDVDFHWVKAVPFLGFRFGLERLQLVLADELCKPECIASYRCRAYPNNMPFILSELFAELWATLGSCIADSETPMGFWLIDRSLRVSPLRTQTVDDAHVAKYAQKKALTPPGLYTGLNGPPSWALNEVLREALCTEPVDGQPAIVARAVSLGSLEAKQLDFKTQLHKQQLPIVSVCTGTFTLRAPLGMKHTVNVGHDDCEQRSWTHLMSFKALRRPRGPADIPICVGEAPGVWTLRIAKQENCTGTALGVDFVHKDVFYLAEDAAGPEMCVCYKNETRDPKYNRYAVVPTRHGECDISGYTTEFRFRSVRDTYKSPMMMVCATDAAEDATARLTVTLDCPVDQLEEHPFSFSALRADGDHVQSSAVVHCVGRSSRYGDRILQGSNCTALFQGDDWYVVGSYAILPMATGRSWCLGERLIPFPNSMNRTNSSRSDAQRGVRVSILDARENCYHKDVIHVSAFRQVMLADLTEDWGSLALSQL